jgi:NAD(P)-dependent dehydrogenase (short-subunit alcohol dehydrogenase family)
MAESKTILVTGSSDGIGLETARQLMALGHRVILHGRNEQRLQAARTALRNPDLEGVIADFSDFKQVAALQEQMGRLTSHLDVLVNNAGLYAKGRSLNKDGIETTLAVNHFAPMLLTLKSRAFLAASTDPRVVTVSSGVHSGGSLNLDDLGMSQGFSAYSAYAASKLADLLCVGRLVREPGFEKVLSVGLHPGVISTKMLKQGFGMSGDSLEKGARTSVYCSTASDLWRYQGGYFVDSRNTKASSSAQDTKLQDALWQRSIEILKQY